MCVNIQTTLKDDDDDDSYSTGFVVVSLNIVLPPAVVMSMFAFITLMSSSTSWKIYTVLYFALSEAAQASGMWPL